MSQVRPSNNMKRFFGGPIILILLCALLWGSSFPVIKLVFLHWSEQDIEIDFSVRSLFGGVRFIAAGLILLIVARQPLEGFRNTPKRWILLMAATQTVGQYACFYWGLTLVSSSLASILDSSLSFWWMLVAPLFLKLAWPSRREWLLVGVGALGVAIAVYSPSGHSPKPVEGAAILLIGFLFGALGMVSYRFTHTTMGPRASTGFSLFIGGIALTAIGFKAIPSLFVLMDAYAVLMTSWLVLVSAAAFSVWNYVSTVVPVGRLASYRFLVPLCAVIESIVFLESERLTWSLAVGGALAIGSIMLIRQPEPASARPTPPAPV